MACALYFPQAVLAVKVRLIGSAGTIASRRKPEASGTYRCTAHSSTAAQHRRAAEVALKMEWFFLFFLVFVPIFVC